MFLLTGSIMAFLYHQHLLISEKFIMKLNLPTVDLETAEDGKWFPFNDTISFRVARDGNRNHKRALQNKFKSIEKMRTKNDFAAVERLTNEMMVKYILKDWKGLEDDGQALPFSEDAALNVISNPEYEIIKEFITDCSQDRSEFETGEDEIVKK